MTTPSRVGDRRTIRVPKTAELVAGHIRRQIVTRTLRDGDALPTESTLMESYGISRPTLREAFRILESEGLIIVRRGAHGGARVQEPSPDAAATYAGLVLQHRGATVGDVLAARVFLEAPAARLLAERRSRARIVEQLRQELDVPMNPETFDRFNRLVVELTGNQTLTLMAAILEGIARAAAMGRTTDPENDERLARRSIRARERLIEFIEAGDGDSAEDLWRRHLTEAAQVLAAGTGESIVDLVG